MATIENVDMDMEVTGYAIAIGCLISGCILCFHGLKTYKILQFAICGLIGASIGLGLHAQFGRNEFYIVAIVLGLIGGYLGYRHYKTGLYLCASISTYLVVVSGFLHSAYEMVRTTITEIPDATTLLVIWMKRIKEAGDLTAATTTVIGEQTATVLGSIQQALELLQRGMLYALIASIIIGVLAILLGDFIIIVFTAFLGGMVLTMVIEKFVQIRPDMHVIILCGIAVIGIVVQLLRKRNA